MSRLASIRLTSTESDSTSLSGCLYSSTSQEYVDSDITMSPLSPKSPMSPRSSRGSRPCSPLARPRVSSLPEKPYNPRDAEEIYRLRSFSITSKGIINRGDSIISKRSRSNTSVCSTTSSVSEETRRQSIGGEPSLPSRPSPRPSSRSGRSGERSPFEGSCCGSSYVSSESSLEVAKYRVVLLGETGVGKSSLVNQFMTSEYINTYDASLDDEFGEKSVSVLLDGEESEVIFIDHPAHEMSVENCLSTYDPHACIIVYSITDKGSFKKGEDIITYLWRENYTKEKAVILVGNKVDLARSRLVNTTEGKSLARNHDCKFIETSSGIQHNVDELLVGVVKQVRLRLAAQRKRLKRVSTSKTSLSLHAAKDLLNKMCLLDNKSKSCENLHVL
ncbi:hypothetical protein O3P69_009619 [Scylla paramamosain]|uniref:Uncharacterized protein n=1 Tax=Scylla paramamosain TaxID=85552 RepID=A0AAW0SVA3_SCYPA